MRTLFFALLSPIFVFSIFFAASCKTVALGVETAGHILEGTAFNEKTVKVYKTADKNLDFRVISMKDGERRAVFTLNSIPYLRFYCSEPDATGHFSVTRLNFLFSNPDGWMEGAMAVSGMGVLSSDGNFSIDGDINLEEITGGAIRRRDRHISGERAVTELRNRSERIASVITWMKERPSPWGGAEVSLAGFESYWRPILLPEIAPTKQRPIRFNELKKDGEYSYGENVRWNTAYTRELFPEHLRRLRDSGSLLRDWEEAAAWFYIYYNWYTIVKTLNELVRVTA
jgi:hypothetical protein